MKIICCKQKQQKPMKKLYNKKGKVHPSPPPPPSAADPLALLPAAILALTVALSAEDQEVLAYLISYTNKNNKNNNSANNIHKPTPQKFNRGGGAAELTAGGGGRSDGNGSHPPTFQCDCFRCYMSFWARWDSSMNRELIHEVIEAYEDKLAAEKRRWSWAKVKKERRKNNNINITNKVEMGQEVADVGPEPEDVVVGCVEVGGGDGGEDCEVGGGVEKVGTMRRLVSLIGEGIWGVWNRV